MSTAVSAGESSATGTGHFQQRLGLFDSTMLVAGAMIGSGIFIVSAEIARDLGSAGWLLAVWVVTGIITIAGALSYAELAAMMPHAGGQYVYLREAYSPLWGFLYGWTLFLVIQTGTIAAVGVSFAKFLGVLAPDLGTSNVLLSIPYRLPWMEQTAAFTISAGQVVAVVVVSFLTWLNCLGVQEGKWTQNIFTVTKTLALALLIVLGLTVAANSRAIEINTNDWWGGATHTSRYSEISEKVQRFVPIGGLMIVLMVAGGSMVGSLFSADAWNNVTFTAGEVKNPRKNLPLSLALGTGLVIVLYILANVAYVVALPVQGREGAPTTFQRGISHAQDDRVATAIMEEVSPKLGLDRISSNFGPNFMAVAIMVSTFGCANGLILAGARLYYAMARDGLFFRSVGKLNVHGVPAIGLILQGVWAALLTFSGTYSQLLDYVIFANLLFYVLTVTGLFVLRRKRPDAERPYRAFAYPVLPAIYVFLCAVIMLDLLVVKPDYTWPGLIIVLTGIPVYFLWRRKSLTVPAAPPL
jgi:APA family basic amino acid/polyamine antiporter